MSQATIRNKKLKKELGFTLLELMVVIGILLIVSFIAIILINPAEKLKEARDTQRISDLNSLAKALDLYVANSSGISGSGIDAGLANFCLASSNLSAKIAYSYSGNLTSCSEIVNKGNDGTDNSTFSTANFCYSAGSARVYNAVNDFESSNNPTLDSVWRHGYKLVDQNDFFPHMEQTTDYCGQSINRWGTNLANNVPVTSKNMTGADLGCGSLFPTGSLVMHPGPGGENDVLRWIAPESGTFTIAGRFFSVDATTTDVHILHNDVAIYDAEVDHALSPEQSFSLIENVSMNDIVDFQLGDGSNNFYGNDSTGFEATITPSTSPAAKTAVDGSGWIPVNFSSIPGGSPISSLPVDPINTVSDPNLPSSTDLVYRYACQGSTVASGFPENSYELNATLESEKFKAGAQNRIANDGGDNINYYEIGSSVKLIGDGTNF